MSADTVLTRQSIRLAILQVLIPVASRNGITHPEEIVESARKLESYVVDSTSEKSEGGDQPDPPNRGTMTLPRKDKPSGTLPEFMTPPQVDKSNQKHR